jgi:hypothetical protein
MWIPWLLSYLLLVAPAFTEFGFDEKYKRDYNIFIRSTPSLSIWFVWSISLSCDRLQDSYVIQSTSSTRTIR